MTWAGYIALVRRRNMHADFSGGNMVERDRLDDLDTDGRVIFT
jgi:hypothetical protein